MKKLLILSGKGGTGKTTTAASFLYFSHARAMADCDVDAPNLHLVAQADGPAEEAVFCGGDKAQIDPDKCVGCGKCLRTCRFDALRLENGVCRVIDYACEGCGVCQYVCPAKAVTLTPDQAGLRTLYRGSRVFSTATLKMGRGNSGKLVTEVKFAMLQNAGDAELAIIDGSPGIGCPVIASITGTDLVLIVAEPSLSGVSDLRRILKTADILRTPTAVCINKADTCPEQADAIEALCAQQKIPFLGRIPYDKTVSRAINEGRSVAQYDCPARDALQGVYEKTMAVLFPPEAK